MNASDIRQKFLDFMAREGHTIVPSSSLIPDDPSVLLTTAGMQQFKSYYSELDPEVTIHPSIGKPIGKNAASVQKSFRTSDIDEVGDESHLTFFEMLGNFSFGGYFKEQTIELAHSFLVNEMGLEISYVTVFQGKKEIGVPKDEESIAIWKRVAPGVEIREEGMEDVFWGPTGSSGPCGPTTEVYIKNGAGQDIEVWNCVFNEYFYPGSREELNAGASGKKLEKLKTPGVDTGMGLERLAMIVQNKKNIFETDLFLPFHPRLLGGLGHERETRIIADHLRASIFLLSDGIRPSNKGAGYILRRLIRRAMMQTRRTGFSEKSLLNLVDEVIKNYGFYTELGSNRDDIRREFISELEKFEKTLASGIKEFFAKFPEWIHSDRSSELHKIRKISGDDAFYFHQSFGLTLDVIKDLARQGGHIVEVNEKEFEKAMERHREISRAGSEAKFGGHGLYLKTGEVTVRDESELEKVTRLHTVTHLMHAGLRAILGPEVRQDGSDITVERTRFDFRFPRKVTSEELKKVEEWVNDAIKNDLKVEWKETDYESALKEGALGFFKTKYPPRVKVYTVFDSKSGEVFSKEFCGGPHVEHTDVIGHFKILKEESSSAGVRRIRAGIE